jgi:hypothetical protein
VSPRIRQSQEVNDAGHVRTFHKLAEAHLAESHERFPHLASQLGLEKYQALLGANDIPTHEAQIVLDERTLNAIEDLPEAAFRRDDWLDRRMFLSQLRANLLEMRNLERWRTNPQLHCDAAVESLFDLVIRNSENLGKVLPALEARLAKLPDFLAAGAECVRRPVPLWVRLSEQACAGAIDFLREIEPELLTHSTAPKDTQRLCAGAARAFTRFATAVARKKAGPENGYCIGRTSFEFLMRERLGFDITLPEARADGRRLVAKMQHLLEREAAKLGGKTARAVLEQAAEAWTPGRPLIEEYRTTTESIKNRLEGLEIMTLPRGDKLKVLPAPPFLRHQFPTAAYNGPQPFSRKTEGIFWVNDLSLIEKNAQKKQAEIRQHFGLGLTCAHEAYPGHHLQFAIQNTHPGKLRRLANHSIYYEGWTMWCEHLTIEHKLVEGKVARLQHLQDALWRAHRIVIDCGLHDGALNHGTACKVLMDGVQFTKARATGDVNWYTSSPTVPMSYLLGRIEVEKLHRRFVKREGWSLRTFNDWILSHGAIPWSWITHAHDQRD